MMKTDLKYMGLKDETLQLGDILQMSMNELFDSKKTENEEMTKLMEKYKSYKNRYVKNIKFDPTSPSLSMCFDETIKYLTVFPRHHYRHSSTSHPDLL